MKKFISILIALLISSSPLWAAPERVSRPATKSDLVGVWDMVSVRPVSDKTDPVFFPHQKFQFRPDSSLKVMVSDKAFSKESIDKFQKMPAAIDYSIDEKGVLTMTWQNRPHSETAVCAYVMKDIPVEMTAKLTSEQRAQLPKKGDVTLSFLNNGKITYQKVLTRAA